MHDPYCLEHELMDLYCATFAVTWGLGFCGLIRMTVPFIRLVRQAMCTEAFLFRNTCMISVIKILKLLVTFSL